MANFRFNPLEIANPVAARAAGQEQAQRNRLLELQQQYTQTQQQNALLDRERAIQESDSNGRWQALQRLGQAAQDADTPEKWADLIAQYEKIDGPAKVDPYRDFSSRATVIALVGREAEKFGAPIAGVDAQGNPAFFQVGASGQTRQVPGFAPPPSKPLVEVNNNPPGALTPTKATDANLDQKIVNAQLGIDRLRQISAGWRPEFSTFQGQGMGTWLALKDKAGKTSPEEKKALAEYSSYQSDLLNNLNLTLNELSGAAVSPAEEERIRGSMPSDKDSPTQFKSKLDATMRRLGQVQARAYIMRRDGLKLDAISLDSVDARINKRGAELEQNLRKSGETDDTKIQKIVDDQLRREFGL